MLDSSSFRCVIIVETFSDPDATRIECLWRVSRRVITPNYQCRDFELLLADVRADVSQRRDRLLGIKRSEHASQNLPSAVLG